MLARRGFLRAALVVMGGGLVTTFRSLTDRASALQPASRRVVARADALQDVSFVDGAIVCRTESGIRVLSARCTHLGCTITQEADGLLVCPCHGSRFHRDGTVARGPAVRPLALLPHRIDSVSGSIVIDIS
jgi:nitrite reductase/ring-hydroxylating ferredoxin subunit